MAGGLFLTKYRADEHTANAYCVNYAVVPCSNPDGSSHELQWLGRVTVSYIRSYSIKMAAKALEDCTVRL